MAKFWEAIYNFLRGSLPFMCGVRKMGFTYDVTYANFAPVKHVNMFIKTTIFT